jgi:membrane protein
LNRIWKIESRPDNTIKGLIFDRILSFGMVLVLGFMLLVTLVVNAVVVGFVDQIVQLMPGLGGTLLKIVTMGIDLGLSTIIFAMLFRFLPDARARWKDIWVGAFFTSCLFLLGKFLIGIYIGNSNFSNTYGAAAALITLLVWTYYNSQIIFLGAEFTFVWAKWSGHPILPASRAVRIVKEVKEVDHWDAARAEGVSQEDLDAR